jgi:ATP-dependent Clp protease ATP-binding subunit ClpC
VHQLVEGDEGGRSGRKGSRRRFDWPFTRFTRRARQVVVLAQEEAGTLGHPRVGSEHLLLGLALAEDETTAPLLSQSGLTADAIRERVAAIEPAGPPRRRRSFTRAAKRVLELSLREAQALGDNFIGAKHILLGLLADERAGAVTIVRELGADPETLATAVRERRAES